MRRYFWRNDFLVKSSILLSFVSLKNNSGSYIACAPNTIKSIMYNKVALAHLSSILPKQHSHLNWRRVVLTKVPRSACFWTLKADLFLASPLSSAQDSSQKGMTSSTSEKIAACITSIWSQASKIVRLKNNSCHFRWAFLFHGKRLNSSDAPFLLEGTRWCEWEWPKRFLYFRRNSLFWCAPSPFFLVRLSTKYQPRVVNKLLL